MYHQFVLMHANPFNEMQSIALKGVKKLQKVNITTYFVVIIANIAIILCPPILIYDIVI